MGTILVAGLAVTALVAWLVRDRRYPGPRLVGEQSRIDRQELERAEQEVRTLAGPSEDPMLRDGWRAGVPRPPERL